MFDLGDIWDGITGFFGSIGDFFSGGSGYDDPSGYYDGGMMPYHDYGALNHAFHEMQSLGASYANFRHLGISQQELELHQQQLLAQLESIETQKQGVMVSRQNMLDKIEADFMLEARREEYQEMRDSRLQEFELNKLKLQFLNQYKMQQNEHEFQLARDLSNFERSVQLANLNAENAQKLENFRQECENIRLKKRFEFEIFLFEKRKEFEVEARAYERSTQVIVANIYRESQKESAEYQRLLEAHPLSNLVTPTLSFYEQFKGNTNKPVPPLVIISPPALEFDSFRTPATNWFADIEPDLTDSLRDFLTHHYPIESNMRPAKFTNGYKTKRIGQENAIEILHWTHQSIPTIFIESKISGDKIRIYLGYWEMMEKTPHYRKIDEFSRQKLLSLEAKVDAKIWQENREKLLNAGKTEADLAKLYPNQEHNLSVLLEEEKNKELGLFSYAQYSYKIDEPKYNQYLLKHLAFYHHVLAALMLDRYYILNYRIRPKLPEVLSNLLKDIKNQAFKKKMLEMLIGEYRLLYLALESQLPNWISELALDLAFSFSKLDDKQYVREQTIYSIIRFLQLKGFDNLSVLGDFDKLKNALLSSDEDYFEKLEKLLRVLDNGLIPEVENFLEMWFKSIREGYVQRRKPRNPASNKFKFTNIFE